MHKLRLYHYASSVKNDNSNALLAILPSIFIANIKEKLCMTNRLGSCKIVTHQVRLR